MSIQLRNWLLARACLTLNVKKASKEKESEEEEADLFWFIVVPIFLLFINFDLLF